MAFKVSEEVAIDASPERVWSYLATERGLAAWNDGLVRLEPHALRTGETCRIVLRAAGSDVEQSQEATVVVSEPPRRLGLEVAGGMLPPGVSLRVDLSLRPVGTGTRLVVDAEAQLAGFLAGLIGSSLLPVATTRFRAAAARLKEAVEQER